MKPPRQLRSIARAALLLLAATVLAGPALVHAETSAERGYRLLTTKAYLPPDFSDDVFADVWQAWKEPDRSKAALATPEERRKMAFARYGLTPRSDDPSRPLQYVVDSQGNWCMSCLACHQGKVAGRVLPGVANSHFALQTLSDEIRLTKLRTGKSLTRMDVGSMFMPLGGTNGTTNAVMFGVVLMSHRDADLNVHEENPLPPLTHHDHDAPAWWQFHRKSHIYIDGFAPKTHRALMQFTLVKENGPMAFRVREDDFRDIYAYLESLRAPRYPFAIDEALAIRGQQAFEQHCATCHGTYGPDGKYPAKCVPVEDVGTDPVRLQSLLPEQRAAYGRSWFTDYGKDKVISDPGGYVAPPLDGVWATAPYFHNGSVPTLWHVLNPAERPVVWSRTEDGYNQQHVGLEATAHSAVPANIEAASERRRYFDTRAFSKSAGGHTFADVLSEDEKQSLLEYLKTL